MDSTRVFIHGLESSGRGTKGIYFREHFPGMIIDDFEGSFAERMKRLELLLLQKDNLVIVGSSYGGLMAAVYACLHEEKVNKLVLLAPALHLEPFNACRDRILRIPVSIFHGLQDDVVPLVEVREIAQKSFAHHTFTVLNDDHSLHQTFATLNWNSLLGS
jgi:predicted esterase